MSSGVGYRTRLKVRIGKRLTTDGTSVEGEFNGNIFIVKSAKQDQPLNEASWIVIAVRGFSSEISAREYGEHLRRAVHLAGLCTRVGVDGRAVGDDRVTSAASDEWLRSLGALQLTEKTVPDTHGLTVLPDDDNIRVFTTEARGHVTHVPREFIRAIEEAATAGVSHDVQQAIRVLNLAHITDSPIAKVVLAISSIEAMAVKNKAWTNSQREMIDQATVWVHSKFGDGDAANEVTDAIRRVHQHSLRQQAKRLLAKHDLLIWWADWENVYGRRSRLFHGGASGDDEDVATLAGDAIRACGRIVLSIAKRQGALLPTAAQVHFGVR